MAHHRSARLRLLLPLLFAAGLVSAAEAPAKPIAGALQPFVDAHRLAGAVVLVAGRDRILDTETVGYADIAAAAPMRADSLFWIASQTKAVTAAALMMLVDDGKVSLTDPVTKYIPEFAELKVGPKDANDKTPPHAPASAITVRQVLCHTSGMRFLNPTDKMVIDCVPLAESIKHDLADPLLFEPGTGYTYSNEGIDAAGLIVQIVSGMPYEQFLQTRLFGPLGMKDTTFFPTTEAVRRLAKSYRPVKDKVDLEETRINYLKYPLDGPGRYAAPGGGLFSTAADVARFCQMLLNRGVYEGRRYLSEAAVGEMTRKQTEDAVKESYGLGGQRQLWPWRSVLDQHERRQPPRHRHRVDGPARRLPRRCQGDACGAGQGHRAGHRARDHAGQVIAGCRPQRAQRTQRSARNDLDLALLCALCVLCGWPFGR
ncbi:MAG: beta-lactamase family protein [Armatimonadetes bacterium]|nr:beta-lactamase family protein [Armatimonadota bacterium]